MKRLSALVVLVAFAVLGAMGSAQATKIEYTKSGSNLTLTVFNDTLSESLVAFDVFFGKTTNGLNFTDASAVASVADGTAPAGSGWSSLAFAPTVVDNPWLYTGFFDETLGVGGLILPGHKLGLIATTVTLAGTLDFDKLWFNVYGLNEDLTFNTLDSGYLTRADIGPAVPEPSTILLVSAGLGGILLYRRKKG